MSELTRCNWCSLREMRAKAKRRKTKVIIENGSGDFTGWKVVRYSDRELPSAYFMELSDHCVC